MDTVTFLFLIVVFAMAGAVAGSLAEKLFYRWVVHAIKRIKGDR